VRKNAALRAKFWHEREMLDRFDRQLLDLLQRDAALTADQLAASVSLSPSAIARRLRRMRADGTIARTIALLAPTVTETRLKALVSIQLDEHANQAGKAALRQRLAACPQVQFAYEVTGAVDLFVLFDCASMADFNAVAEAVLVADATVRRYETSFIKAEAKFAPFVGLAAQR
jgi:Lrp/AsnC family leucine-responsive transcriptional regulator